MDSEGKAGLEPEGSARKQGPNGACLEVVFLFVGEFPANLFEFDFVRALGS